MSDALVGVIGWSLVHAVWQDALIALVLAALLLVVRPCAAVRRYALSCAALSAMVVLPVVTASRGVTADSVKANRVQAKTAAADAARQSSPGVIAANETRHAAGRVLNAVITGAETSRAPTSPVGAAIVARVARAASAADAWMAWLVSAWLFGVLVLTLRMAGAWVALRHMVRTGVEAPPRDVLARCAALQRRLGVTIPVRVLQSVRIDVPAVIGSLRPVLLLPVSAITGLSPRQLDAVIAHELAHIRRHDYLVNVCQHAIETLLFFHPAVWWVSSRIRAEREHCCDDEAVRACGDALTYGGALLALEEQRGVRAAYGAGDRATGLAVAATHGRLPDRIRRLLFDRPARPHRGETAVRTLVAAPIAGLLCVTLAVLSAHAVSLPRPVSSTRVQPTRPAQPTSTAVANAAADVVAASEVSAAPELLERINESGDRRVRRELISQLSGDMTAAGWTALVDIAASHPDPDTRKTAISYVSGRHTAESWEVLALLYARADSPVIRRHILSYIHGWTFDGGAPGERARALLVSIARSEPNAMVRRAALEYLSGK